MVIGKATIDLAEKLGDLAAQATEELRSESSRDSIAAIERDFHRPREPDVGHDSIEVRGRDVHRARVARPTSQVTAFDARSEALNLSFGERRAGDDHLEP